MILYNVDICPVCSIAGYVLALKARRTCRLVFYCPHCSTAWKSIPPDLEIIHSLEELAPSGVVPATLADLNVRRISVIETVDHYDTIEALL